MPDVRGDRVQLQQVVLNLLLNAFDAMKDSDRSDRTVLLNIARIDERMLKVSVTDAGQGLPAGCVERVLMRSIPPNPTGWAWAFRSAGP